VFHRQDPASALARALATRPTRAGTEAVAAAYGGFLERLLAAFEELVGDPLVGPWPAQTLVLDSRAAPEARFGAIRDGVRPLLDEPSLAAVGP
jgi:hypothetical protein